MSSIRRFLTRRWLVALLTGAALLFSLAMLQPYLRQSLFGPTIRGKPWCVWDAEVRRYVHRDDFEKRLSAKMLRWLGVEHQNLPVRELFDHPEMLPLLLALMEDEDHEVRLEVVFQIGVKHGDDPSVQAAWRQRVQIDQDPRCRARAAFWIWRLTKDKEPLLALAPDLQHSEPRIRMELVSMYGEAGKAVPELVPHIIERARDPHVGVRVEVILQMSRFGTEGLPTLILALEDPDWGVRDLSIRSLDSDAKAAIPALERRLNDGNNWVRESAAKKLAEIEPARSQQLKGTRKIE